MPTAEQHPDGEKGPGPESRRDPCPAVHPLKLCPLRQIGGRLPPSQGRWELSDTCRAPPGPSLPVPAITGIPAPGSSVLRSHCCRPASSIASLLMAGRALPFYHLKGLNPKVQASRAESVTVGEISYQSAVLESLKSTGQRREGALRVAAVLGGLGSPGLPPGEHCPLCLSASGTQRRLEDRGRGGW